MRAMILAAGRGERMRPLTDTCPKPLLRVGPHRLIEYHVLALARAGICDIVINTGWLAAEVHQALGDGRRYGVKIYYSDEGYPALETAGGIANALSLLGSEPFIVVNGDIYTDFDFATVRLDHNDLGHLVLVPNPAHHPGGDFSLRDGRVVSREDHSLTFSGIALYRPELFDGVGAEVQPLKPIFDQAIACQSLSGEVYDGIWQDIGTPERLAALAAEIARP